MRLKEDFLAQTALILIDWQKAFSNLDYWGRRNNPEAEANAERLLAHWRRRGWPIIHVKHNSTVPGSLLHPDHAGNAFADFAIPREGESVYEKSVNSAFIETSLENDLRSRRINHLIFCGVTSDHCVNTTARMAGNLGFEVTLAGDACYTFDRKSPNGAVYAAQLVHEVGLASLNGEFANIAKTSDFIDHKPRPVSGVRGSVRGTPPSTRRGTSS